MSILFLSVHHPESEEVPNKSLFRRAWDEMKAFDEPYQWLNINDAIEKVGSIKCNVVLPFYFSFEDEKFVPFLQEMKSRGCVISRQYESLAKDKFLSAKLFDENKTLHPKTILLSEVTSVEDVIKDLELPCVAKPRFGMQGKGVQLVKNVKQIRELLNLTNGESWILQKLVTPYGKDIRAYVVGGRVVAAMERYAPQGELVTNYTLHKNAQKIELSQWEKDMAVQATKLTNLSYAGVDLMRDGNGKLYVLEVNSRPAISIEEVTGVNVAKAWLTYFIKQKTPSL